MKIPNAERAYIDIRKLRGYCLNPNHPRGKHKAKVFESRLGLTQDDAAELAELLRSGIIRLECLTGESDEFGRRFIVDSDCTRNERTAQIRSAWIIKADEDFPRLISCYVL